MMLISSSISRASPTSLSRLNTCCSACRCKPSAIISSPTAKIVSVISNRVRCSSSSSRTPESGSGDNDSKTVLDAFFLGKAFAEALNERIESTVGEILSGVGQWQAEQQKQVLEFQEEVIVRARRTKEKAALQAMEEQGVPSKSLPATSDDATPVSSDADDPLERMLES